MSHGVLDADWFSENRNSQKLRTVESCRRGQAMGVIQPKRGGRGDVEVGQATSDPPHPVFDAEVALITAGC